MPLYEYECDACGRRFELIRKFSDPPVETCTLCGKGPVSRLFSSPAIQFKGSGWYITDYAQKGKTETDSQKTKDEKTTTPDSASSEPSKADTTSAAATTKPESAGPATPAKASGSAKD